MGTSFTVFRSVAVLLLIGVVVACTRSLSDLEQIRRLINGATTAANEKKPAALQEMIAPDYLDSQGRRLPDIQALIASYFYYGRDHLVRVREADITVDGDRADAKVHVLFGRRHQADPAAEAFPDDVAAYLFDVGFRRRERGWQVVEAVWRRVGERAAR